MKLVDEIRQSMNPLSSIGGRKVEKPDRALVMRGWREPPPEGAEPARTVYLGIVESHRIPPHDPEPAEASWADLPATFSRDGLYGGPR